MARKRIIEAPALRSWEEVNAALREIAEEQIAVEEINAEMNRQVLGAKKSAEQECKPHFDRIAKLERDIRDFAEEHRGDLGKAKSRTLTYGEVGYRLTTSVVLPKAKEKLEEILRRLKARQMNDCIIVEEQISRNALKKYGADTVNAVGAQWRQKETFGYDVFTDKVERLGTAGE